VARQNPGLFSGLNNDLEPITARIRTVQQITGWSRNETYRKLAAGEIEVVKDGSALLIGHEQRAGLPRQVAYCQVWRSSGHANRASADQRTE
jgi:hypothetical protein